MTQKYTTILLSAHRPNAPQKFVFKMLPPSPDELALVATMKRWQKMIEDRSDSEVHENDHAVHLT